MNFKYDVNLANYNTFGLPSVAKRFFQAHSKSDIEAYFASNEPQPDLVLGGGSNLLLTKNIEGTVLKVDIPGIEVVGETNNHVFVKVGAGEVWHQFVLKAIAHNWAGIENLSLIPGNVGTAPMQNIGAYGVEIKSVFHELEAYMTHDHCWETFDLDACQFGYRESVFKQSLKNKAVITSVTFRLDKVPTFHTQYGAIEHELEQMGVSNLSIKSISDAVINIRRSKLPDPAEIGNSGSFFKNPIISKDQFNQIKDSYPEIVGYPSGDSHMKVAAGWLIEKAGFKGKRWGNYGVHDRQALVLVNYGGAIGADIFKLSEEIIHTISDQFGIKLEREVNVI